MDLPNLRTTRLQRLLTQRELAARAQLTMASISRIETGATKARISTVHKLAAALDVNPVALLETNEPLNPLEQRGSES